MRRTLIAAALAAVLCLAFAATASADSLVFIKDNNLWTSKPDGSQARALTTNGDSSTPYRSPSQADNGTILVQRETQLGLFDKNGRFVCQWAATTGSSGPWDPVISPDGSKWAHWVFVQSGYSDPSTNTYFSRLGSPTVWGDIATGRTTGFTSSYKEPSWLQDSQHALVFDNNAYISPSVYVAPVNEWTQIQGWYSDKDTGNQDSYYDIAGGDLSAQGTHLVVNRATRTSGEGGDPNQDGNNLTFYNVNGTDTPPQRLECPITGEGGAEVKKPSFSPGGDAIVYSTKSAVYRTPVGNDCSSLAPRKILDGATEAFWGPADHPAVAPARQVGCKGLTAKKRIACAYRAAVAKCKTIAVKTKRGRRKRARCIVKAKRARAVSACKVRPASTRKAKKARARCIRVAKRRYR